MTDWQKKIKALEDKLEQLESYTARQKRVLDDLLANLDDDNMSETLLREKKQMKDKDIQLQSMIEQTAGSITMQVKKTFVGSSGIRQYENNKPPYHPLEEHLIHGWADYLWENVRFEDEKRYYFWNELVGGWSYTDTAEIQSLFVQTADGFYLSKEVVIEKGSNVTVLGISGSGAQMAFNGTDGSINLYGSKLTIGDSGYDGNVIATRAYVNNVVQSALGSLGND